MAILTITTTAAHDARIAPAFGENFGGNATLAQVRADVIAYISQRVLAYEQRQSAITAMAAVTTIIPT